MANINLQHPGLVDVLIGLLDRAAQTIEIIDGKQRNCDIDENNNKISKGYFITDAFYDMYEYKGINMITDIRLKFFPVVPLSPEN